MRLTLIGLTIVILGELIRCGHGQDAAKLAPYFQQQRNLFLDGLAQCNVSIAELQARVAELEKKLAEKHDDSQQPPK